MMMLASTSLIVIFCGIFCLSDTELVWQLYEWDCRMMNITPLRPYNRMVRVKQAGYALICMGVVGLILSLGL